MVWGKWTQELFENYAIEIDDHHSNRPNIWRFCEFIANNTFGIERDQRSEWLSRTFFFVMAEADLYLPLIHRMPMNQVLYALSMEPMPLTNPSILHTLFPHQDH